MTSHKKDYEGKIQRAIRHLIEKKKKWHYANLYKSGSFYFLSIEPS